MLLMCYNLMQKQRILTWILDHGIKHEEDCIIDKKTLILAARNPNIKVLTFSYLFKVKCVGSRVRIFAKGLLQKHWWNLLWIFSVVSLDPVFLLSTWWPIETSRLIIWSSTIFRSSWRRWRQGKRKFWRKQEVVNDKIINKIQWITMTKTAVRSRLVRLKLQLEAVGFGAGRTVPLSEL